MSFRSFKVWLGVKICQIVRPYNLAYIRFKLGHIFLGNILGQGFY